MSNKEINDVAFTKKKLRVYDHVTMEYYNFYHLRLVRSGTITKIWDDAISVFIDDDRKYLFYFSSIISLTVNTTEIPIANKNIVRKRIISFWSRFIK